MHCNHSQLLSTQGALQWYYERLNETVLEGTVLTYQCDNGLSLAGPNNICHSLALRLESGALSLTPSCVYLNVSSAFVNGPSI